MENSKELLEQLFRLEWLLRMQHMHHHRDHGPMASPHRGQGRLLALLALKPRISQRELASILDIRSQSLGELLAKLEKQGYITRTPSEEDKRGMDVALTEAGKKASEAPEEGGAESFLDALNAEEQESFAGYLTRLIERLEKQIGPELEGRGFHRPFGGHGPGREGVPGYRGFGPHRGHGAFHGRPGHAWGWGGEE